MTQVKDGPGVIKVEGETHFIYRFQMVDGSYPFFSFLLFLFSFLLIYIFY